MKPTESDTTEPIAEVIEAFMSYDRDFTAKEAEELAKIVIAAHRQALEQHNDELEYQGIELIQPIEGMCYVDGKWQMLEEKGVFSNYETGLHARMSCSQLNVCHPLYRLIPLQEET